MDKNKHCRPTLYHEFTHMWDSENIFKYKEYQERKSVLSLYTEYHASQIEFFVLWNLYKAVIDSFMYVFGIKSIFDKYIGNVDFPKVDSTFHENIMNIYPLLQDYKIEELWEIFLKCSKNLDNLHILNSI